MNIDPGTLLAQYQRAYTQWPFIDIIERQYALPSKMLSAVGSRETNLTNEVGDGGHGHGVWQLDNRSHVILPGFDQDVKAQCVVAASMLKGLLNQFGGNDRAALAAYNAGANTVSYNLTHGLNVDIGTAGNDYSADTAARMTYLQTHTTQEAPDMDAQQSQQLNDIHNWLSGGVAPGQVNEGGTIRGATIAAQNAVNIATVANAKIDRILLHLGIQ
jgi:hypothetical protein